MEDIARACFVIDGNYTRKGFSHLAQDGIDGNYYSINFSALTEYTASLIEAETGTRCVFSDKKVFMGTNAEFDRKTRNSTGHLMKPDFSATHSTCARRKAQTEDFPL